MEAVVEATPLIVYVCNSDVLALLERCYQTTDRYDKEQTSPLASLEARWLYSASLAGLLKYEALSIVQQCISSCSYGPRHSTKKIVALKNIFRFI